MKIVGIIVEYNPLHNGHLIHINKAKEITKADCVVAVMSSSFSMRGDISSIDKFSKTEFALNNGIDLVIELPFISTVQNADIFAYNAVSLLSKLNIDYLCFGSESNDLNTLSNLALTLDSKKYNDILQKYLHFSYPKASNLALTELGFSNVNSNDQLGIQYIRALNKLNSKIKPFCIQREHSDYNDKTSNHSSVASATAIRNMDYIKNYVPKEVNDYYIQNGFLNNEVFFEILKYKLIITNLDSILGMNKDLVGLFKNNPINNYDDINNLVSSRYTRSRINRLLLYILFDIKKNTYSITPNYHRVLGMTPKGQEILNQNKKNITIISKVKEGINHELDLELKVTKFYSMFKDIYQKEFDKIIKR